MYREGVSVGNAKRVIVSHILWGVHRVYMAIEVR